MSNVHGLFSGRKADSDSDSEENKRFVGGISSQGGGRYDRLTTSVILIHSFILN